MPVLNFREIASPTTSGQQDTFELFARDFLSYIGFEIADGPDRGPDGGRDLIAIERRRGIAGETVVRWLVSCKHKAHSNSSVGVDDEQNVRDRIASHNCGGFVGFYSTIPSSGLTRLIQQNAHFEIQWWDRERIERELLHTPGGITLAKRYFPKSIETWTRETPQPADLYSDAKGLSCEECGINLLNPPSGIIVFMNRRLRNAKGSFRREITDVYWCCKGHCDRSLGAAYRKPGVLDGWKDISDLTNPIGFIRAIMVMLNRLHKGERYRDEAFCKYQDFLLEIYRYVAREPTTAEEQRLRELAKIPSWLGGYGSN